MQEYERLADAFFTETVPFDIARQILSEAGIQDAVKADKNIKLLAGRGPGFEIFCKLLPHVLQALKSAADPDMALNNWERLVEVIRDRTPHFRYLCENPSVLEVLLKILGVSQYLTDILILKPHLFHEVIADNAWMKRVPADELRRDLIARLDAAPDFAAKLTALREFKKGQMLRVGMHDICGEADVAEIIEETTLLAEASIEAAFEIAKSEAVARYGIPMETNGSGKEATAVVIAFGKLGGKELNYSSDIDLIFMYSSDGETRKEALSEGDAVANHEFFCKLAEKCIDLLSRITDKGGLFRVDMRLRPMGSKGPLVSSLESHLNYYEIFGETWERQALLKARPVAGDKSLGEKFLREIRPFVYPKYLDHRGIREIQDLKWQIEREVDKRGQTLAEVKLGRGGIRDIEFTVQFLQLLHGGRHPELRRTNTLATVSILKDIGLLSPAESASFIEAYKFLRKIENRLQIIQNQQLHVLPSKSEGMELVARSLGYRGLGAKLAADFFMDDYRRLTGRVRELFNKFFGKLFSSDELASPVLNLIMNPNPSDDDIEDVLGRYGFKNPVTAYANLRLLSDGPAQSRYTSRERTFFSSITPLLLQHLAQSPDPDMGLNNLQSCVAAMGAPAGLYEVLAASPKSIELFVALSSYSDYLIRLFVNDPGVLDFLLSTRILEEESSRAHIDKALGKFLEINPDFYQSVQRFKNGEILRIGLRDILGLAELPEVTRELSSVAEVMLSRVYKRCLAQEVEQYGEPRAADGNAAVMSLLALGKFGGREINYASDLDIVFVYSGDGQTAGGTAEPISNQQFFNILAAQVMKKMAEATPYGYLYKMDARLRPDGEQGLLAVSAKTFTEYHRTKSALWEKRALVKMRPTAGDAELGRRLLEFAHSLIYHADFFSADIVNDARQMLSKIFQHSRSEEHEGIEIKNAEGGIVEIEFLVQLLQLKHGVSVPELRKTNTLETLDELTNAKCLSRQPYEVLIGALVFLRRIENRLRLLHDRPLNELPTETDALNKLALRLGIRAPADSNPGEMLLETLQMNINRAHRIFMERLKELTEVKEKPLYG